MVVREGRKAKQMESATPRPPLVGINSSKQRLQHTDGVLATDDNTWTTEMQHRQDTDRVMPPGAPPKVAPAPPAISLRFACCRLVRAWPTNKARDGRSSRSHAPTRTQLFFFSSSAPPASVLVLSNLFPDRGILSPSFSSLLSTGIASPSNNTTDEQSPLLAADLFPRLPPHACDDIRRSPRKRQSLLRAPPRPRLRPHTAEPTVPECIETI
jgi:hypothetical protein